MYIFTYISFVDVFLIFFFTLGPLKALDPFAEATRGLDSASSRSVAWRSATIAGIIMIGVALVGAVLLENWRISVAAVVTSGSIIIFFQSLPLIMEPLVGTDRPITGDSDGSGLPSSVLPYFPVAVPALITAPGLAAILVFMAIARGDWSQTSIVLGVLLIIMVLNLITLLNARTIKRAPTSVIRVIRWVMAALQAVEAVQYLFNGLIRAGVFRP